MTAGDRQRRLSGNLYPSPGMSLPRGWTSAWALAVCLACSDGTPEAQPGALPDPVASPAESPATEAAAPTDVVWGEAEQQRLGLAQQAMLTGLPEHVHEALGPLLDADPVAADVQFVAGSAAYELHDYGEAVTRLTAAIALDRRLLPNSSALGFAHIKRGDFEAARAAFQAIVTAEPTKHKAHYGLGFVALALGELEPARNSLAEALRLSPDYLKAHFAQARLLHQEGRNEEALEALQPVLERWPSHEEAIYLQGRVLGELGRHEEAEVALERHRLVYSVKESLAGLASSLGTERDSPLLRARMAELHLSIGDGGEARRALAAGLALFPSDPTLLQAWEAIQPAQR